MALDEGLFNAIMNSVKQARLHQIDKHGDNAICNPLQHPFHKYLILGEEVGEVARALDKQDAVELISELVQVAACSVGWLESILATAEKYSVDLSVDAAENEE